MRPTKLLLSSIAMATLAGGVSQSVSAGDSFTIIPQIAIQNKGLDFSQRLTVLDGSGNAQKINGNFDTNLPTISAAITGVAGRFFLSAKYETNYNDVAALTSVPFTGAPYYKTYSDIDRRDINITLGLNAWEGLNIFAGYIAGKTEIKPSNAYIDVIFDNGVKADNSSCIGAGLCNPTVFANLAKEHEIQGFNPYKQKYEESGGFLGTSYGFPIDDYGTLSTSLAYAIMEGRYGDNYKRTNTATGGVDNFGFIYKGKSKGTSIALSWTASLGQNTGYYIDIRRQMYEMNGKDKTGLFTGSVRTKEHMTTVTMGVQMYL